jgi:hypothetical protein
VRPTLLAIPLLCAACTVVPGSVLLSNPDIGPTEVEAVLTTSPDCLYRGPGFVSRQFFVIPDNGTRFIEAPIGTDMCWRSIPVVHEGPVQWSNWRITYTYPGRSIDSDL